MSRKLNPFILSASYTKGVSLSHQNVSQSNPVIQNTISIKANADNIEQMPTNEKHDVILNNPYNDVHYDSPTDMQNTETQTDQQNVVCRNANIIGTNDSVAGINANVIDQLKSQNEFLKMVIEIYMNQKLYYSGKFIVCSKDELILLIQSLTGGIVEIETEPIDVDCGCVSSSKLPYIKISNIWITLNDTRTIFKYDYANYLTLFDSYRISLKLVRT